MMPSTVVSDRVLERSQIWLAVSLRRGTGRGLLSEDGFEVLQEEPEIIYSQIELLRERIQIQGSRGTMFSNGSLVQEASIVWDEEEGEGEWRPKSWDDANEAWLVKSGVGLEWTSFLVEDGLFWTREIGAYREMVPLRQIQNPSFDIRLHTLSDLSLDGMNIDKRLSLREWTIDAAAVLIFLERPEYSVLRSLDLSDAHLDGAELGGVLRSAWHSKGLEELRIDGALGIQHQVCVGMPNLICLSARGVGWNTLHVPETVRRLDIRQNPLEEGNIVLPMRLEALAIDTSVVAMAERIDLKEVYCTELHFTHLPEGLYHLSCTSVVGEVNWEGQQALCSLQIPDDVGLPRSPSLQRLSIVGGSWDRERIEGVLALYPSLRSFCVSGGDVTEDILLSLGGLEEVGIINCDVHNIAIPDNCSWKKLDVSDNPFFQVDDWRRLERLEWLNVSNTNSSLDQILRSESLMGLQFLGTDGLSGGEAFLSAHALFSLSELSFRNGDLPVLLFVSQQSFLSLKAVDLGGNTECFSVPDTNFFRPRIRVDVMHSQMDKIRWLWRDNGHADIFHRNSLFFPEKIRI